MEIYNNHNLYILGAGFSHDANMPLMSNFMTRLKEAYNWYDKKSYAHKSIKEILDFRKQATSSAYRINLDLDNIEDLFNLAVTEGSKSIKLLRTGLGATLYYCDKVKTAHNYQVQLNDEIPYFDIERMYPIDAQNSSITCEINPYDYISSIVSGVGCDKNEQLDSVISLNYDTILEASLNSINQSYSYYLDEEITDLKGLDKMPIIKLHGSMNWVENDNKIIIEPFNKILEKENSPFITPPIWTKGSNNKIPAKWYNALKLISSATRIIIIGFHYLKLIFSLGIY